MWHDNWNVHRLSTVHDCSMLSTDKRSLLTVTEIQESLCVTEYNQNRSNVNKTYMQMTFSESLRNSVEWYNKLFFSCDEFIGSRRLHFIQRDTTRTSLALLIQT